MNISSTNYGLTYNDYFVFLNEASNPETEMVHLKVALPDNAGNYVEVANESKFSDSNGSAIFEIGEIVRIHPPDFSLSQANIIEVFDTLIKFRLDYSEGDISPLSIELFAFQGETDFITRLQLQQSGLSFYEQFVETQKRFLTYQPNNKAIDIAGIERLYYLPAQAFIGNLVVKLYFTDGTDSTHVLVTGFNFETETIYSLKAGFNELNLQSLALTKTVSHYELYIINGETIMSELRKYRIDTRYFPNQRYFILLNSLHTYDVIRSLGPLTVFDEIDRQLGSQNYREIQISKSASETHETSLGWLGYQFNNTGEAENYKSEILKSNAMYIIMSNFAIPIIVTNKKERRRKDQNYLPELTLNYKLSPRKIITNSVTIEERYLVNFLNEPILTNNQYIIVNQ